MRRNIIIGLCLWFAAIAPGMVVLHYYLGYPITMEIVQLVVLGSFIVLNILYLFFKLLAVDTKYAVMFIVIFASANFLYAKLGKGMEPRTELLSILLVLAAATMVILHFLKKASAR